MYKLSTKYIEFFLMLCTYFRVYHSYKFYLSFYLAIICVFIIPNVLFPQTVRGTNSDTSSTQGSVLDTVFLIDESKIACSILEQNEGVFIRVQYTNGHSRTIPWPQIKKVFDSPPVAVSTREPLSEAHKKDDSLMNKKTGNSGTQNKISREIVETDKKISTEDIGFLLPQTSDSSRSNQQSICMESAMRSRKVSRVFTGIGVFSILAGEVLFIFPGWAKNRSTSPFVTETVSPGLFIFGGIGLTSLTVGAVFHVRYKNKLECAKNSPNVSFKKN